MLVQEDWVLVLHILRMTVTRDTNKIYVPHKIAVSDFKPSVVIINQYGLVRRKIPIKKIRSKSLVLKKPIRKHECIMVAYEHWERGCCNIIE